MAADNAPTYKVAAAQDRVQINFDSQVSEVRNVEVVSITCLLYTSRCV